MFERIRTVVNTGVFLETYGCKYGRFSRNVRLQNGCAYGRWYGRRTSTFLRHIPYICATYNSVHKYTCIHMMYIKSSESKGTLVLSIVHKLGRMESLTV